MAGPLLGLAVRSLGTGLFRSGGGQAVSFRSTVGKAGIDASKRIDDYVKKLESNLFHGVRQRTPKDKGNAQRGWRKKSKRQGFRIENNVEYIGALNEGHSRQAPAKFIQREIRKQIKDTKL